MTTKQYLNQIHRIDQIINNKLSEIYQLKNLACSISVSSDSDRVQTSSNQDPLGNAVAKIVDLENEDKPDWCPLREMPEKKKTIGTESETERIYMNCGWNDCIDAIGGGDE